VGSGLDDVVVRADDVVKSYRHGEHRIDVLRGVSLAVARGELVAIVGPSGSGKSTLLHLLGGLDVPDAGAIVVGGRALAGMCEDELTVFRRRHVGFVFQTFNLIPTLSAEENVALPLRLDGLASRVVRARATDALAAVGLRERHAHRPDQLSGGEIQRVAVARALVLEPCLILADEPTGSLDARASSELLRILRQATSDRGRTIVMVTHDPRAAACADRVLCMTDGSLADDTEARAPRRTGAA
jgi:putative ABC transport system ATP-binding protein